jgi:hypothetical protein
MSLLILILLMLGSIKTKAQFVIDIKECVLSDFGNNERLYSGESDTSAPFGTLDWKKKQMAGA